MNLRGNTKQIILDHAEELLVKRGFNGFSYKNISTALGIKNAAIHYHYPTKSDLGVEIIQRAKLRFQDWADELKERDLSPSEKLKTFFDLYRNFLGSKKRIFLAGALEANFKTLPEEMQKQARDLVSKYLAWIEDLLKEGRESGSFSFPGSPRDQAIVMMSILHGALHLIQVTDHSWLDSAIRQIKLNIGA